MVSTPPRRSFVWAQTIVVYVFVELALWAPTRALRNRWALLAVIAVTLAVLLDRPSRTRLGFRFPTARAATLIFGVGAAAALLVVVLTKLAGGQIPANAAWSPAWSPDLRSALGYLIWALLQEFILQSFFLTRFEDLYGGSTAVWIAASLFALAHLPSPILTIATLIGALFFCEMFRRYRSLYPLAIVHAVLGLTLAFVVPDSLLHHMRVGIGYLRY
jgi:membrane protease YdiL (CAAX protease family)